MFTAALFPISKTWKQPNCPSTDDWVKTWYMYTMGCYSAIKNHEVIPFAATLTEPEVGILSVRHRTLYVDLKVMCDGYYYNNWE